MSCVPPRLLDKVRDRLPVNWWLLRCSGSSALKNGAAYSKLTSTLGVMPRVRIGESRIPVLVPPESRNSSFFCEYCSVAKYFLDTAPLYVTTNKLLGVVGLTRTDGSSEKEFRL